MHNLLSDHNHLKKKEESLRFEIQDNKLKRKHHYMAFITPLLINFAFTNSEKVKQNSRN